MEQKQLNRLASEHNAEIISFEPFLAIVKPKNETYKVQENGIERIVNISEGEKQFNDVYLFCDYCRGEVYTNMHKVIHNGWNN